MTIMSPASNKTKVVVVGGSWAGVSICTSLETLLPTAEITLLEERSSFYNAVSSIRVVVEPNFSSKLWVPYTNLFKNPASRVIRAKATNADVEKKMVETSTGMMVEYDYLVVATGTRLPAPGKTDRLDVEDAERDAERIVEAVRKATSVTIVGGGVVGIELAGEIATDYPHVKVTLLHSGPELLHTMAVASPALRKTLLNNLQTLKVNVLLNERVIDTPILPSNAGYNLSQHTITTKGNKYTSDVQFDCTGRHIPNSEWIVRGLGKETVDERGFVRTERTGQVVGHSNIFALGDIATLDDHKVALSIIQFQTPLIVKNIKLLIDSKTSLHHYTPVSKWCITYPIIVSTGRNGGASQLPFIGVLGNTVTWFLKSGDLMVRKPWAMVNMAGKVPE